MKRIMITGASGFIGWHCIKPLIERDFEIYAICNKSEIIEYENIHCLKIDLFNNQKIKETVELIKPDYLLHLAWNVEPSSYMNSNDNIDWVNASMYLIKTACENGCKKVVTAGTCLEYEFSGINQKIEELKTPITNKNLYAVCKTSLYNMCTAYCSNNKVKYAHGRVFYIYGPRENKKRVVPYVINSLIENDIADLSSGMQIRDYTYVKDVANAFVEILVSDVEGAVNIGTGNSLKLKDLFVEIGKQLGKKDLIKLGAIQAREDESRIIIADNEKLITKTQWKQEFSLSDGVRETITWWKSNSCKCCPVCGSKKLELVLERKGIPVFQNKVFESKQQAIGIERGDMHVLCCDECGFIFNSAFDPSLLQYDENYNNIQSYSNEFKKYTNKLVNYLNDKGLIQGKKIIEIGCGKGDFLRALSKCGAASLIGFDPTYEGVEQNEEDKIKVYRKYYNADCIGFDAEVIICRHVIEHIQNPLELLKNIRTTLDVSKGSIVFFETPDIEWILKNHITYDFLYEHCSYFSEKSIITLFNKAGYKVEEVKHEFLGQYMWVIATPILNYDIEDIRKNTKTVELANTYSKYDQEIIEYWKNKLIDKSKNIAIWGASAKGVMFLNIFDSKCEYVKCAIDINPIKQNKFLPGTGHLVISPNDIIENKITDIIIMNDNYSIEIKEFLDNNKMKVNVISMLDKVSDFV